MDLVGRGRDHRRRRDVIRIHAPRRPQGGRRVLPLLPREDRQPSVCLRTIVHYLDGRAGRPCRLHPEGDHVARLQVRVSLRNERQGDIRTVLVLGRQLALLPPERRVQVRRQQHQRLQSRFGARYVRRLPPDLDRRRQGLHEPQQREHDVQRHAHGQLAV